MTTETQESTQPQTDTTAPSERQPDPSAVMRAIRKTARAMEPLSDEERARFIAALVILFSTDRSRELIEGAR